MKKYGWLLWRYFQRYKTVTKYILLITESEHFKWYLSFIIVGISIGWRRFNTIFWKRCYRTVSAWCSTVGNNQWSGGTVFVLLHHHVLLSLARVRYGYAIFSVSSQQECNSWVLLNQRISFSRISDPSFGTSLHFIGRWSRKILHRWPMIRGLAISTESRFMTVGGSPPLDSKNDTVTRSNRCKCRYGNRSRTHTRTSESKNHRKVMAGNKRDQIRMVSSWDCWIYWVGLSKNQKWRKKCSSDGDTVRNCKCVLAI